MTPFRGTIRSASSLPAHRKSARRACRRRWRTLAIWWTSCRHRHKAAGWPARGGKPGQAATDETPIRTDATASISCTSSAPSARSAVVFPEAAPRANSLSSDRAFPWRGLSLVGLVRFPKRSVVGNAVSGSVAGATHCADTTCDSASGLRFPNLLARFLWMGNGPAASGIRLARITPRTVTGGSLSTSI